MDGIQRKLREITEKLEYRLKMVIRRYVSGEDTFENLCETYNLSDSDRKFVLDFLVVELGKQMYQDSVSKHSN